MIVSFGDRATEALYHGIRGKAVKGLPPQVLAVAVRKLDLLNTAQSLAELASPPGNRLEALRGNLQGSHSVRINDQWRIVFRWEAGAAYDVRILDYHR